MHDITKFEDLGVNYKDKTATEEVWDLDNPTISITVKETYLFTSKRDLRIYQQKGRHKA